MDIEKRIYQLATDVFGFDFGKYLEATGRVLLGVTINPETKTYGKLFGDMPVKLLSEINKKFEDSIAGYSVDIGSYFLGLDIKADVFMLNVGNMADGKKETDSLLLHELCHMVIDSNSISETKITIGQKDEYHGNRLYNKTDIVEEYRTKHNKEFCYLLAAASEIASEKYSVFQDRWDVMNSAMRYDLKTNKRQ